MYDKFEEFIEEWMKKLKKSINLIKDLDEFESALLEMSCDMREAVEGETEKRKSFRVFVASEVSKLIDILEIEPDSCVNEEELLKKIIEAVECIQERVSNSEAGFQAVTDDFAFILENILDAPDIELRGRVREALEIIKESQNEDCCLPSEDSIRLRLEFNSN